MKNYQESKLNMYRAVKLLLENNIGIISPIVAFLATYNAFKAKLSTLITTVTSQAEVITGITTGKTEAKKILSNFATDIAAIVYAYADSIGNNPLKESNDFTYTDLIRIKDDLLPPTCQNIHDNALANLAPLADYGITALMLTAFQTSITNYSMAVPKPRNAKNVKETFTKNIRMQITDMDNFLKNQLDKSITIFKNDEPDLISTYHFARIIVNPGSTVTQLKGIVTKAADNTVLKGVKIEVNGPVVAFKLSDNNGEFAFKPVRYGYYQICVSLDGYEPVTIEAHRIKLGRINHLEIALTEI